MKRKIAVVLILVLLLTLTACGRAPKGTEIQIVEKNGEELFVVYHFAEQTITVGKTLSTVYGPDGELLWEEDRKDQYSYEYEDGDITITYPNGATYWESASANGAIGGWDGDYDTERYIDGMILAQQLNLAYQNSGKNWDEVVIVGLVCLLIIGLGIVDIMHPELLFSLRYRLWVRDAEPTEFALMMSRIGGVICIVLSVIMFLIVLFR